MNNKEEEPPLLILIQIPVDELYEICAGFTICASMCTILLLLTSNSGILFLFFCDVLTHSVGLGCGLGLLDTCYVSALLLFSSLLQTHYVVSHQLLIYVTYRYSHLCATGIHVLVLGLNRFWIYDPDI